MSSSSTSSSSSIPAAPSTTKPSQSLSPIQHLITIKLNRDNYLLWKAQISPYFKGQHLFGFLDGTQPAPPQFLPPTSDASSQSRIHYLALPRLDDPFCPHLLYFQDHPGLCCEVCHISRCLDYLGVHVHLSISSPIYVHSLSTCHTSQG
jgi:hypothetical protein